MPRFVVKKLPPQWLFLPSKRQVRELLTELGADVRLVGDSSPNTTEIDGFDLSPEGT